MKTRGLRNNNPFNIKKSKNNWIGKIKGTDKEFETFDTLDHGYRAGLILLANYYTKYKLHSYRAILRRFAPATENNLENYESYIYSYTHVLPDEFISLNFLLWHVAPYIARFESSLTDYYDDIIYEVTTNICKLYKV